MENSKIVDKGYAKCLPQIKTIDFSRKAEMLGIQKQDQLFIFDFFNRQISFDGNDFIDIQGHEVTNAIYDLSVDFRALPKVPIILNFNDTDELMPANAVFLYHDDAETYLDLESLTIICTYLTGLLIQAG